MHRMVAVRFIALKHGRFHINVRYRAQSWPRLCGDLGGPMLKPICRLLACALIAIPLAAPAAAAPAAPAAREASGEVTIPFAPPIGLPLRYRSERQIFNVAGSQQTLRDQTVAEEELVFTEKNAEGYVLRWTTTSAKVQTSPDRQRLMEQVMGAAVNKPLLIQTDMAGRPVSIRNFDEFRAMLVSTLDAAEAAIDTQFASRPPAERENIRKIFAGFLDMYRNMTDEQANSLLLEEANMILGLGGATLAPGRPATFQTKITLPMVNTEVDVMGRIELRAYDANQTATVVVSTATSPDGVKAAAAAYLDKALVGLDPTQREVVSAGVRKLESFSLTDELVLTIASSDGVPQQAEYRKRGGVADQGQLEIKSLRRLP